MIEIIRSIFAIAALLISMLTGGGERANAPEKTELYPSMATVTKVDYKRDIVVFTDPNGFAYAIQGTDDWAVGDKAALMMDDNGTQNIRDDKIVRAIYKGR